MPSEKFPTTFLIQKKEIEYEKNDEMDADFIGAMLRRFAENARLRFHKNNIFAYPCGYSLAITPRLQKVGVHLLSATITNCI